MAVTVLPKPVKRHSFRAAIAGEPVIQSDDSNTVFTKAARHNRSDVNTIMLVLEQMARDESQAHFGLAVLTQFIRSVRVFTLATFEVWRALVQHPQALRCRCSNLKCVH